MSHDLISNDLGAILAAYDSNDVAMVAVGWIDGTPIFVDMTDAVMNVIARGVIEWKDGDPLAMAIHQLVHVVMPLNSSLDSPDRDAADREHSALEMTVREHLRKLIREQNERDRMEAKAADSGKDIIH